MLDFVSKGLTTLYGGDSIFTKATAMQILFDGVDLNCKQTDFDAKAICSALEAEAKSIEILDDQIFRLSLFGMVPTLLKKCSICLLMMGYFFFARKIKLTAVDTQ